MGDSGCFIHIGIAVGNIDSDNRRKFFKKKIFNEENNEYSRIKLTLELDDEAFIDRSKSVQNNNNESEFGKFIKLHEPDEKQYAFIDILEDNMDNFFKSSHIIKLVLKWKWHLVVVFILSVLLSIVFSEPAFIKPKYKSFAVVYPSNIAPYSDENNTEQMLQLLKSDDLLMSVIKKFHLNVEYGIDTADKFYRTKIISRLESNVSIRKTEYESIVIEIFDQNAVQACDMVKEFINFMNLKARELQRNKTSEIVKINYDQMTQKLQQIDSIEKRMNFLRSEYNILDYKIQVKEYSKGHVKDVASGRGNVKNEITTTLDNLKTYGGEYRLLDSYLLSLLESYNLIKTEYDKSLSDLTKELTYTNIVTNPVPAEKKSYPIRWLIVTITSISALLFSLMLFSFIGARRKSGKIAQ